MLPGYIEGRRWFASEGRELLQARVIDSVPLSADAPGPRAAMVRVDFTEGEPETLLLPLGLEPEPRAGEIR
ncbi:MAG TPA: hypothetical protein VN874_04180, partial [Myxococcales bacterium]|nr:hypothetical protein [Myxococcales bacterium]